MSHFNTSSSQRQNEAIFCCDMYKNPLSLMEVAVADSFLFSCMKNASQRFVLVHTVSYTILLV